MSENQQVSRPNIASREVLGMVLFTASAFPLVLVAMALAKGQTDSTGGTAAIAHGIVQAVGFLPGMVAAGGFAVVGAAMALSGKDLDVGRHLSGFLFTALGLAVCLGALHAGGEGKLHAGSLGDATGGALLALGPWAGLVIGGAVAFAAVWLAWLGGLQQAEDRFRRNGGQTPTISDALSERDADGVSSAEANALVPDEATLSYMEELWSTDRAPQLEPIPPSPYPDDVRLAGKVPEGAAVLALDDDEHEPERETFDGAHSWRPPEANRPANDGVDGDLADATLVQAVPGGEAREPAADPQAQLRTGGVRILADHVPAQKGPPVPAWEQPALFTPSAPVTAQAPVQAEEDLVVEDEADEEDLSAETPVEDEEELEEETAELEEDEEEEEDEDEAAELEEGEDGDEEEEEEDEEAAELEEDEEEEDEEEDEEAAELEDDEEEEEEDEAAEYDEDEEDEEDEDEEEDEEAAELEEDDEEEEEEDEEAAELEEGEEEEEELEEELTSEDEDDEEEEEEEEAAAEDDEEELVAEEEEEPDAEPSPEPEIVIQPAAPPETSAPSTPLELDEGVVQEAGRLFLTHGRVAVSLLQRRFGLEFDDACEVLDELQELGLIGPYMGGQKRDILMTAEQWEGRLAGS